MQDLDFIEDFEFTEVTTTDVTTTDVTTIITEDFTDIEISEIVSITSSVDYNSQIAEDVHNINICVQNILGFCLILSVLFGIKLTYIVIKTVFPLHEVFK